jgi:hypothetical protein
MRTRSVGDRLLMIFAAFIALVSSVSGLACWYLDPGVLSVKCP